MEFKKGGFLAETSIQPFSIKYWNPFVSNITGLIDGFKYYFIVTGCLFTIVDFRAYPTFRPNEYFWEHHQKEGEERWETYARIIREIIHEGSGIPYC